MDIEQSQNRFQCGNWIIEAELNAKHPASLYIHNKDSKATFGYGKKKLPINDKKYECKYKYSSILYDKINGLWKTQEMEDRAALPTGKIQ